MTTRHTDDWNKVEIPRPVKFDAHYERVVSGSCWISTYSSGSHGYAQIGWTDSSGYHVVLAHRASWEFAMGPMDRGMTLDHTCKNIRCVKPEHLRVLSNFDNARRTGGRDWELGFCANGHPDKYLIDTSRRTKSGKPRVGKRCSECKKLSWHRYNWRSRHPGEPMPEHLLLASEKLNTEQAA